MKISKISIYWSIMAFLTMNVYSAEDDNQENDNSAMQAVPKPESSEVTIQAAPAPEPEYIVREWTKEDQKNSDELERTANFINALDNAFTYGSEIPFYEAYSQVLLDEAQQKDKK